MLHELDRTGARKPGQYTAPAAPLPVKQDRKKHTKRKKHDDIFNKISMHPKWTSPGLKQYKTDRFPGSQEKNAV